MTRRTLALLAVAALLVVVGATAVSRYNGLVRLDQAVSAQWPQVESTYQRRADLVPTAVTEARARVGQVRPPGSTPTTPAELQKFQQAQDQLSSALSRLLVVSERYPELHATAAFRDLQVQLEGTENRIAVERMRFNDAAREFNNVRATFPTVLFAGFFGSRFAEKAYFQAQAGAATAPTVRF